MSDLTRFRDHCEAMSTAEHKPECRLWVQRPGRWAAWEHPSPDCGGCVTDADRALFARLAAEVDDYLEPHPTLWGDDAAPEPSTGARGDAGARSGVPGPSEDGESL